MAERSQLEFIINFDKPVAPEKANQFIHLVEEEIKDWPVGRGGIYDCLHSVEPEPTERVRFTVRLTGRVDERDARSLHERLKGELEFGDLDKEAQRWRKTGWGMGKARVMKVEMVTP